MKILIKMYGIIIQLVIMYRIILTQSNEVQNQYFNHTIFMNSNNNDSPERWEDKF